MTFKEARKHWGNITERELMEYFEHYTTGKGRGLIDGVGPKTTFREFVIASAEQSKWEQENNV